jgi:hypothetical protein
MHLSSIEKDSTFLVKYGVSPQKGCKCQKEQVQTKAIMQPAAAREEARLTLIGP